jgi:glycerol uptake facilitator protein
VASPLFGEFVGTFILILLGDGVVAGVLLKRSKGENAGWFAITTGWAFAVFAGVFTAIACGSSDAHLNPAVTLGAAVASGDFSKFLPYAAAQLLGAFLGAVAVWIHYLPHWALTNDKDLKLGTFCTIPAVRHVGANLTSEVIGTFVLALVAAAIFSGRVSETGVAAGVGPLLVGCLVWGIGLSLGGTTGYAIQSGARSRPASGSRVTPIAGKRDSDWGYAAIPVVGPLIGAALAGLLVAAVGF